MRRLGLVLCVLLSPVGASAIRAPTASEKLAIQGLIDRANAIILDPNRTPATRDIDQVASDLAVERATTANPQVIAKLEVELKSLKNQRDLIYRDAIIKTLVAYDLVPVSAQGVPQMPKGSTVHPKFAKRNVSWIVVYQDDADRTLLDNHGATPVIPPGGKKAGGMTGVDGITTMYGKFYSPADLALLLYHEKVHFDQFTTKGVGDKLIFDEREEKAYSSEYRQLPNFGLSPAEMTTYTDFLNGTGANPGKIREHHGKALLERQKWNVKLGLYGNSEPPQIRPRTSSEYAELNRGAGDFEAELAAAATDFKEKARVEREDAENLRTAELIQAGIREKLNREALERQAEEIRLGSVRRQLPATVVGTPAPRSEAAQMVVRIIAERACATPRQNFDGALADMNWDALREAGSARPYSDLSACEQRVFEKLMTMAAAWYPGQRVVVDDVLSAAAEPAGNAPVYGGGGPHQSPNHEPVWGKTGIRKPQ